MQLKNPVAETQLNFRAIAKSIGNNVLFSEVLGEIGLLLMADTEL
jgi:hypothetical protein